MDETLEALYKVRELSMQKEENERNISQLYGQIQSKQGLIDMKNEKHKTALGRSGYILIYVVAYMVVNKIVNRVLSFMVLMLTKDMLGYKRSFEEAFKASKDSIINPVAGMIITIPLAFIITMIVRAIIKRSDKKKNQRNVVENKKIRGINEQIAQANASADANNQSIMEQIAACEQLREEIMQKLRNTASWYPEIYFSYSAVDYIIQQLETGKANSLNQAIVHYEAI